MRRRTTIWTLGIAVALVTVAPALSVPSGQDGSPNAGEQLAGTTLTVVSRVPYETAVLRVSGPDGYALDRKSVV